jgi:DNA invertase Pin-like site-specific DNA recombinase
VCESNQDDLLVIKRASLTNFAYLRVSRDTQDVANQKFGILDYCNVKGISPITLVEDTESRKKPWRERGIGQILKDATEDDVILASEISRLGGSPLQVLEILEEAARKKTSVHIVKSNTVMDGSLQSAIIATVLGLAAQIEREFISVRTKEALARRRAEGVKLGRPRGEAPNLKLDSQRDVILDYLRKNVSRRSIARILECSPSTLYSWLRRNKIK